MRKVICLMLGLSLAAGTFAQPASAFDGRWIGPAVVSGLLFGGGFYRPHFYYTPRRYYSRRYAYSRRRQAGHAYAGGSSYGGGGSSYTPPRPMLRPAGACSPGQYVGSGAGFC